MTVRSASSAARASTTWRGSRIGRRVTLDTPFGAPSARMSRPPCAGAAWRSSRGTARATASSGRTQLPGQHLGFRAARRRSDPVCSAWQPSRGLPAARHRRADQFFDRTKGRVSTFFAAGIAAHVGVFPPRLRRAGRAGPVASRGRSAPACTARHLRVHGGTGVLDPPESQAYRSWGFDIIRHDEPAGGEARPRGGDLLHHGRPRDRLRLLAPGSRLGDRRADHREPAPERDHRPAYHRRSGRADAGGQGCGAAARSRHAIITRPNTSGRRQAERLRPSSGSTSHIMRSSSPDDRLRLLTVLPRQLSPTPACPITCSG